jgi:hypothetical protein
VLNGFGFKYPGGVAMEYGSHGWRRTSDCYLAKQRVRAEHVRTTRAHKAPFFKTLEAIEKIGGLHSKHRF